MKRLIASALLCAPAHAFAQAQPLVTIGGDRGVELGVILDVAAGSRRLLVLDKNAPHIRVLDESGRLLQTTGRRGSGPGEFSVPFTVSFDSSTKSALVVDPANARVTEYALVDTLRLTRTMPTSVVNLRDVCVVRGRLFGISGSRTHLLDELEVREERLVPRRALGKPQSSHPLVAHPLVAGRTSEGPLLCDDAGFIWVASRFLGEIQRINIDGDTQQTVLVRDFHPIRLQAGNGGSLTFSMPEDGWYEQITSLVPTPTGVRVVLTRFDRKESITGYQFVDLTSDLKTQSPRVPAQWRETGAVTRGTVCVVNDPVPTVAIFAGTRCP